MAPPGDAGDGGGVRRVDDRIEPGAPGPDARTLEIEAPFSPALDRVRAENEERVRDQRSPLADLLPTFRVVRAWATRIAIPSGFTVPSGHSAWYGLASLRIPGDFGQDFALSAVRIEQAATDNAGGGGEFVSWGDTMGSSAAVVVGTRLPIQSGSWTTAVADVVGVETSGAPILTTNHPRELIVEQSFPPGGYADATPNKWTIVQEFGAFVYRLTSGDALDVALVLNGAQAQAGANKTLRCHIGVQIKLGQIIARSAWGD